MDKNLIYKILKVDVLSLTLNIALSSTIIADYGTLPGNSHFFKSLRNVRLDPHGTSQWCLPRSTVMYQIFQFSSTSNRIYSMPG